MSANTQHRFNLPNPSPKPLTGRNTDSGIDFAIALVVLAH
jgi:hypothetical protein